MDTEDNRRENEWIATFERIEKRLEKQESRLGKLHSIITDGLVDKIERNRKNIERLDNRLWILLSSVGLSILLQVVFHLT